MQHLRVSISVGSLDGTRWLTLRDVAADSGTSHTALPASTLRELGIEPTGRADFRYADGSVHEHEMCVARIRIEASESLCRVAFLPEALEPRLGFITLADMGLEVDPEGMTLVPAVGYLFLDAAGTDAL